MGFDAEDDSTVKRITNYSETRQTVQAGCFNRIFDNYTENDKTAAN